MGKERTCQDCGGRCAGRRCRECSHKHRAEEAKESIRRCCIDGCNNELARGTKGEKCFKHRDYYQALEHAGRVLEEEALVAPRLTAEPKVSGDWLVLTDLHIPFHYAPSLKKALKQAVLLKVRRCIIAGDLIHADIISRYANAGQLVKIGDELAATGRVLEALLGVFDEIRVIMGNHDQRLEKLAARWKETKDGQEAMDIVSRLLDVPDDSESVSSGILEHFFGSDKVKLDRLTSMTVNGDWKVLHPGTCSRVSPQTERRLAEKFRKSTIGGHNHLFGIGFDASGTDLAANIGHCSDDTKFRYMREKITTFPTTVRGWGFILCSEAAPRGRFLPIADHDKWFDLEELAERLR